MTAARTAGIRAAGLPGFVGRPSGTAPGPDGAPAGGRAPGTPLTRLTVTLGAALLAIVTGGLLAPALVLLLVVLPLAVRAGVTAQVLRAAVLLALPVALAATALNLLIYPEGTTTLGTIGPFRVTAEGIRAALVIVVRVAAIAAAAALFVRTTRPDELVADLEARGVPQRVTFVAGSVASTLPAIAARGRAIAAVQRARGMDTEGSAWRRARGIVPLVGPVVLGSIAEAEERTLALESRAFGRPGGRTVLWAPAEAGWERAARWGIVALVVLATIAGPFGARLP